MKKRKAKVLFYYPQHFNRSKEGTNPYFDPLIKACQKNGITYEVWEEPDGGTDKPRNPKAKKADTFFWTVTIIRKLLSIILRKKDFYQREKYVTKIFNLLTFNRYKYERYITISGSMFHLFAEMNPKAKVFDLQHGIVFKHQDTFFEGSRLKLKKQFYNNRLHFLFWGKGYEESFIKGEEEILNGRTHVIGYLGAITSNCFPIITKGQLGDSIASRKIVISLQFTHSISYKERLQMKQLLCNFLERTKNLGYKVLLKNHPRFNNSIEIDDIFERFQHTELTCRSIGELARDAFLHVTFYSTTAFEFASFGVPTFFLHDKEQPLGEILFKEEYLYPLYWDLSIEDVITRLQSKEILRLDTYIVSDWYNEFYSPFNEENFIKSLDI